MMQVQTLDMMRCLKYAACCVIPTFATYSARELTRKELALRMVLELILIEGIMLFIAFTSPAIDTGRLSVLLAIAGSVLVIYILARAFSWIRDSAEAKALNTDLMKFQEMHNKDR